jgi:hypothetical protein
MYDLWIGLTFENLIRLSEKYRYDFIAFNSEPNYGFGPLNSSVFVFRTIKDSCMTKKDSLNNVLVDIIHYTNINAFDAAIHGDCHFHSLDIHKLKKDEDIVLTDIISLKSMEDAIGTTIYAVIKDQKLRRIDRHSRTQDNSVIEAKEVKYMLFRLNDQLTINCSEVELAKIFQLQVDAIWHNNRHFNFNQLHKLDIDKEVKNNLDPSTPWEEVKKLIEEKRKYWEDQSRIVSDDLISKLWSLDFEVID